MGVEHGVWDGGLFFFLGWGIGLGWVSAAQMREATHHFMGWGKGVWVIMMITTGDLYCTRFPLLGEGRHMGCFLGWKRRAARCAPGWAVSRGRPGKGEGSLRSL